MRHLTTTSQRAECLDCDLAPDATASFTRAHAASTGHTATFVFERMVTYHGEPEQSETGPPTAERRFGRAVRDTRAERNYTADHLRTLLLPHDVQLTKTQMSRLERGERPIRLNEVAAICIVLGLDAKEFLS